MAIVVEPTSVSELIPPPAAVIGQGSISEGPINEGSINEGSINEGSINEGMVLAGRYRVLDRTFLGWLARDERFSRSVVIAEILGGGAPAERVRREVDSGAGLLDAVIIGGAAFAIRAS